MRSLREKRKKKGVEPVEPVEPIEPVEPVVEGGDLKSVVKSVKRTYNKKMKPVLKNVGKQILENAVFGGLDV